MLAFDFMVRIKYYKGYVEPGGSIFNGVRYVGGGGLTYYIYEVTIITCIMLMIDICNDELELDGIITAFMLFPPVSQMFSYKYTL